MFSKRPLNPPPAPRPAGLFEALNLRDLGAEALRRPGFSAGGAGALLLTIVTGMVLFAGDPSAGAPSVHIKLTQPGAPPPPPGWREALSPDVPGEPAISQDNLQLLATAPVAPDGAPMGGQAVITLPGADGAAMADHSAQALPPAPLVGLTAPGPGGSLLPTIAADGRAPYQAYARPFRSNGQPKVALVIGGLGLNAKSTREAIEQLPPEVTLSFVPYAEGLQAWIDLARANGHEVLLEAPMEPNGYPDNDPGPYTLLTANRPPEMQQKLDWLLSRATGYFGVTNYLGSKFVNSDSAMSAFDAGLKRRGLAFVDDGSASARGGGLPRLSADRVIDDQLAGDVIDKQLQALESSATRNGQALGAGFAYPVTLAQVSRWTQGLNQRGYQLAPASALLIKR